MIYRKRLRRVGYWLYEMLLIVVGSALIASAVNSFLDPNDVVPGGFTALAIFANRLWAWPIGLTTLLLNVPFILLGMAVLGVRFGPRTLFAVALSSAFIDLSAARLPEVAGEPLLYVAYGGLLYGIGIALVFRAGATTGGTEIPAKLLERWFHIRLAESLLVMDLLILSAAALFFGLAPALYALIVAWVMSRVIDVIEMGWKASLSTLIVTDTPDTVRDAILAQLDRGVTLMAAEGGFTGDPRTILYTVITRRQLPLLRRIVSEADTRAFVVVNQSHEVLGEGFAPLARGRVWR